MNDYLKILFFILFTHVSFSQIYEVGFTFGKSNFIGDVGSTTFINPNENLFGGVFKWNRSPTNAKIPYIVEACSSKKDILYLQNSSDKPTFNSDNLDV